MERCNGTEKAANLRNRDTQELLAESKRLSTKKVIDGRHIRGKEHSESTGAERKGVKDDEEANGEEYFSDSHLVL